MATDTSPALLPARCRVFLSYARADRARVTPIFKALEPAGFEVWWDALIVGGSTFAKTIASALDASDVQGA